MNAPTDTEQSLNLEGYQVIAGVDEAGRGALAGPVVAACVVMPLNNLVDRVRDSKLIGEPEREELYEQVVECALYWSVGVADNNVIDRINILQATFRAMRTSVRTLGVRPDVVLVDGPNTARIPIHSRAMIDGDALCYSIAAASIIAKVTRDRLMRKFHKRLPVFGFDRHKGYGTVEHREAIRTHGASTIHRQTFLRKLFAEQLD